MPSSGKILEFIDALMAKVEEELEDFIEFIEPQIDQIAQDIYQEQARPMDEIDRGIGRVGIWAAISKVAQERMQDGAKEVLGSTDELLEKNGIDLDDFMDEENTSDPLVDKIKIPPPPTDKKDWN
jgi:hypothetical protein